MEGGTLTAPVKPHQFFKSNVVDIQAPSFFGHSHIAECVGAGGGAVGASHLIHFIES